MAESIESRTLRAKLRLLDMHFASGSGHIGGNLSCFDVLMVLHHRVMKPKDRFILSKGHAAGALYATLWSLGELTDDDLVSFGRDGTRLPGHPSGHIPGLMFPTGSLGHGPSLAAGLALAARQSGSGRKVYCVCSDGEWQEGSCWEALIFAVHQQLNNLVLVIDQNRLQGFGRTEDVVSYSDLAPRLAAFCADVVSVNGHDLTALEHALLQVPCNGPSVVVAETIKGRGLVNEDQLESHYLPMTSGEYAAARRKLIQDFKG